MATLTGSTIASTYKQLLKVTSEGIGADASAKYIEDGLGTDSALSISTTRVGIGVTAPEAQLNIAKAGSSDNAAFYIDTFSSGINSQSVIGLRKSNSNSIGTETTVEDDEKLGKIAWYGGETDGYDEAASIHAEVDGTPGSNDTDMPGALVFGTTADGTGSTAERMRITSAGKVGVADADPSNTFTVKSSQGGSSASAGNGYVDFYAPSGYAHIQMGGYSASPYGGFLQVSNGSVVRDFTINNEGGNVGIGTTAPGQLLDVNSGGGNMIADGYDTHSLAVYKENIEDASGYLDKVLACPSQKWNRKPFVSANEIKEAVLEEFGEDVLIEEAVDAQDAVYETVVVQEAVEEELWAEGDDLPEGVEAGDVKTEAQEEETEEQLVSEAIEAKDAVYEKQYSVWDELFPEDNSHRQKALYNMPDGDLKTWIDDWCESKRVEMRPENKWQKKRLGLVADAELTAEHLPEVVSINDDGEPTGIDTMTYIGILHNAIQELSAKVEALENA